MRVAVLVTCFNRVQTTLSGLAALHEGLRRSPNLAFEVFLVDDASADATGKKVKEAFPSVNVTMGSGSLFWNGGMCLAYEVAGAGRPFDAYVLFNDDVAIFPEAMPSFVAEFLRLNGEATTILAGATVSKDRSEVTYSGFNQTSRLRPRAVEKVVPCGENVACDTFNGNFVWIPGPFFEAIGGLDRRFGHAFGDIALGLTAGRQGVRNVVYGTPIGMCEKNDLSTRDTSTVGRRRKIVDHPAYSFADFKTFVREFRPVVLFPLYCASFLMKRELFVWFGRSL